MVFINKYKKLFFDTALFTISVFASRVLSFFMLPFYTSVLTTSDYGIADLIATTVNLMIPLCTLSICDAVLRFVMDKDEDYTVIFMTGFKIVLGGCLILLVGFPISVYMNALEVYTLFYLTYIVTAFYTLLSQFARGRGYVKTFAFAGVLSTVVVISCNLLFLLVFNWGLSGYLLSTIIAYFVCIIYIFFSIRINRYFVWKKKSKRKRHEMITYAIPLVPNSISWWINMSLDRYILTALSGVASNGIYSVANKLPTIFSTFSDIFIRAWQLSAVSEFDSEDRNSYYRQVYKYYNVFLVLACTVSILFTQLLARILFADEFYIAWKAAPFLMIAAVFSAFNGFIGSVYTACKQTKILLYSTVAGAICNTVLNFVFIPFFQEVGAAIATLCSYCLIWFIRCATMSAQFKSVGFLNLRFIITYVLLFVQAIILLLQSVFCYPIVLAISIIISIIFNKDIIGLIKQMIQKWGLNNVFRNK